MSGNIGRRLDRLGEAYRLPDPPPPAPAYDFSALTMQEQYELDGLLARCAEPTPTDPRGFRNLSDDDLERLHALALKVQPTEATGP